MFRELPSMDCQLAADQNPSVTSDSAFPGLGAPHINLSHSIHGIQRVDGADWIVQCSLSTLDPPTIHAAGAVMHSTSVYRSDGQNKPR